MSSSHPLYSTAAIPLPQADATNPLSVAFGTVSGQRLAQAIAADQDGITAVYADSVARVAQTGYALVQSDIDHMRFFRQADKQTLWVATGTLAVPVWIQVGGGSAERIFVAATQVAHGFTVGTPVRLFSGVWVPAQADAENRCAHGVVTLVSGSNFEVSLDGRAVTTAHGLTTDNYYWLDQAAPGVLTVTRPATGLLQSMVYAVDATTLMVFREQPVNVAATAPGPIWKTSPQPTLAAYMATGPTDPPGTMIELASDEVFLLRTGGNPLVLFDWIFIRYAGKNAGVVEIRVEADLAAVIATQNGLPRGYTVKTLDGKVWQVHINAIGGVGGTPADWVQLEGGAGADTYQQMGATGSVLAWGSLVITTGALAVTATLPNATAADIGKKITVRAGTTANTTVAQFAGNTLQGQTVIKTGTAVTYEVYSVGNIVTVHDMGSASSLSSPDANTSVVSTNGQIAFNVNGTVAGTATIDAGTGLPKWTLNGILDPAAYAGTAQTVAQRDALVLATPALKYGYKVWVVDAGAGITGEYQNWTPTGWKVESPIPGKFKGLYSSTTAYDALDMVVDAQGALWTTNFSRAVGTWPASPSEGIIGDTWRRVAGVDRGPFNFVNNYAIGAVVYNPPAGAIGTAAGFYRATAAHTGGNAPNPAGWTPLSAASADTTQTLAATGNVVAWNSIVLMTNPVAAAVATLPTATASDIGKTVQVKRFGSGVATVAPFGAESMAGQTVLDPGQTVTYEVTAVGVVHATVDSGVAKWGRFGNAGTVQAVDFIGTTDAVGLSLRTNNVIRQTISPTGDTGFGTTTPAAKLHNAGGLIAGALLTVADQALAFTIPAATIDACAVIGLGQLTPNIAFTLGNATTAADGRVMTVINQGGAAGVTVNGNSLPASRGLDFVWDGTWRVRGPAAVTAVDFWRSGRATDAVPTTLPDGTTDSTEAVEHHGGVSVGAGLTDTGSINALVLTPGAGILTAYAPTRLATAAVAVPERVLRMSRVGTGGVVNSSSAEFRIGKYTAGINANTQVDLVLGETATHVPVSTVQTWLGNGNTGFNTSAPLAPVHAYLSGAGVGVFAGSTTGLAAVFDSSRGATANLTRVVIGNNGTTANVGGGSLEFWGNSFGGAQGNGAALKTTVTQGTAAGQINGTFSIATSNNSATPTDQVTVLPNGNTGLGIALPVSRLHVAGGVTYGATDFAGGGVTGVLGNVATVDGTSCITVNQTAAGAVLTLSAPTNTTAGREMLVVNRGTATFSMHGVLVAASRSLPMIWTGSAWAPVGGAAGGIPVVQTFTASGTYTPTAGMVYCVAKLVGGGAGGGGCAAGSTTGLSMGYGGGAGGEVEVQLTAAQIGVSQAVTIGGAGTGGIGLASGNGGGPTSLGALASCGGGFGGPITGTQTGPHAGMGGAGGTATVTTGTAINVKPGENGGTGFGVYYATTTLISATPSYGGGTSRGPGGRGVVIFAGNGTASGGDGLAGGGRGAGGGGACSGGTGAVARNGGAGIAGTIVITEYF